MADLTYRDIALTEDVGACLLCAGAPCTAACPYGVEPDTVIRSLRFENTLGAARRIPDPLSCVTCTDKACLTACVKSKINRSVPIDEIMMRASSLPKPTEQKADLSIEFCGVHCENPFFLSSSVVGSNYEMVAKAFEMGWSGVRV